MVGGEVSGCVREKKSAVLFLAASLPSGQGRSFPYSSQDTPMTPSSRVLLDERPQHPHRLTSPIQRTFHPFLLTAHTPHKAGPIRVLEFASI